MPEIIILDSSSPVSHSDDRSAPSNPLQAKGSSYNIEHTSCPPAKRRRIEDDLDPIVFTSSLDATNRRETEAQPTLESMNSDLPGIPDLVGKLTGQLSSSRSFEILSDIDGNERFSLGRLEKPLEKEDSRSHKDTGVASSICTSHNKKNDDNEAKKAQKELERRLKGSERQRKKAEREIERRNRQLEKEKAKQLNAAIADVNRSTVDKDHATADMVLELPGNLVTDPVEALIREHAGALDMQVNVIPRDGTSNTITFRRKIRATFDEEADLWRPAPESMETVPHVLSLTHAADFAKMALESPDEIDFGVILTKSTHPDHQLLCIIQGLETWLRKNKNRHNRAFREAVAASRHAETPATNDAAEVEERIENALLRLQLEHDCLIHHTAVPSETAECIISFAKQIAAMPRADQTTHDVAFCMDYGQIKTGDDPVDTFRKMLQQITRLTPQVARGITAQYGDVTELVEAFRRDGKLALQDIRVGSFWRIVRDDC